MDGITLLFPKDSPLFELVKDKIPEEHRVPEWIGDELVPISEDEERILWAISLFLYRKMIEEREADEVSAKDIGG